MRAHLEWLASGSLERRMGEGQDRQINNRTAPPDARYRHTG